MKYIVIGALLALTACAKSAPPPVAQATKPEPVAVQHPSVEFCDKVYDNLLTNIINEALEEGQVLSPSQLKVAKKMVDQQGTLDGKKADFYAVCAKASQPMADCWLQAGTLEGMDLCTTLWQSSLHPQK